MDRVAGEAGRSSKLAVGAGVGAGVGALRPADDGLAVPWRVRVVVATDGHREFVTGDVLSAFGELGEGVDVCAHRLIVLAYFWGMRIRRFCRSDSVGSLEAGEPLDLGGQFGLLDEQGVVGGDRGDLGVVQGVLADVLDGAHVEAATHDLVDELALAFDGLPHIGVEALLCGPAVHGETSALALPCG